MQVPLSILIYQRVVAKPDALFPETVDARRLEQHLRLLRRWFKVLPLTQAVARLRESSLPSRAACITFDDGYAEHAAVALPILQRFGMPATFFVASDLLGGASLWRDAIIDLVRSAPGPRLNLSRHGFGSYDIACTVRRRAVIDMLLAALAALAPPERVARVQGMTRRTRNSMLDPDQLLALHRAGMEIGAHTSSHATLASLSNAEARAEIANGRAHLENLIQAPVRLFAYPSGKPGCDFEQRHAGMLRAQGFAGAVTTLRGAARQDTDPFALPRFTPWDHSSSRFLLRMGSNLFSGH